VTGLSAFAQAVLSWLLCLGITVVFLLFCAAVDYKLWRMRQDRERDGD
jgi:hypothetical protein